MATVYPNLKDASLKVTKYLPAAAADNQTATFDLNSTGLQLFPRWIEVSVPAIAAHTDSTKNITLTLQDSADDSTYADTDVSIRVVVPGVLTSGSAAATFRVPVPPDVNRYLQFKQEVDSGGPAATTTLITYEPIYANI
jgi:hypothetical protein